MTLKTEYKFDLIDQIMAVNPEFYKDHGLDRLNILSDTETMDRLWIFFQKSIEDYGTDYPTALHTAFAEVFKISPEDWGPDTNDPDKKLLVYIASPYAGDVEANVAYAMKAAQWAIKQGVAPLVPHLMYPALLDDNKPEERELGLSLNMRLLRACDAIWLFACKGITPGMQRELDYAMAHGIPVKELIEIPD